MSKAPPLKISNLSFSYANKSVLQDLNLEILHGQFVGIIGPNGSGKSTLIKCGAGFLKPDTGSIKLFGKNLQDIKQIDIAKNVAVVPQEFSLYFPYKVYDFVMMGRFPYQNLTGITSHEDHQKVMQALFDTGTEKLKNRNVLELSGGEKQRVVLASALAQDTKLLLLDEPTSSLDLHFQIGIYSTLKKLNIEREITIIAVTHDLNLASLFCDRLILMSDGMIQEDGSPADIVTEEIIQKYYDVQVEQVKATNSKASFVLPINRKL